tara:strand:+ start:1482 stop:2642 length:1161 start_codon:yes stop_codon:yes gene_type:complete
MNSSLNKVYICGLVASAKGTLRALLDSHPKIINNPFDFGASFLRDDFIAFAFRKNKEAYGRKLYSHNDMDKCILTVDFEEGRGSFSIGQLFIYLFTTDRKYADLFDVTCSGKMRAPNLPGDFQFTDYNFSVFSFLNDFVDRAFSIKNFSSIEHLQDTFYEAMFLNCNSMGSNHSDNSLFVQSSLNGYNIVEWICKRNINYKILAVVRDPVAHCYANYNRNLKNSGVDLLSKGKVSRFLSKYPHNLYSHGFINKVKHFNDSVEKLNQKDMNVYVVRTEDIICKTRETMGEIADFLGIEHREILYKPTVAGDTMNGKMLSLVGSFQDDPYKALSESQVDLMRYYFYGHQKKSLSKRVVINVLRLRMAIIFNNFTQWSIRLFKRIFPST